MKLNKIPIAASARVADITLRNLGIFGKILTVPFNLIKYPPGIIFATSAQNISGGENMKSILKQGLAFLMVLAVLVVAFGCARTQTPARKPVNPSPTNPAPNNMTRSNTDAKQMAMMLAQEAKKVKGVTDASVVISGTTAYVGLDLTPGTKGTEVKNIERMVTQRLKAKDKKINQVVVTADADLTARIKALSSFATEMAEITRRLTPKKMTTPKTTTPGTNTTR